MCCSLSVAHHHCVWQELQAQLQKNNQDRLISLEEVKEILAEVDLNGDVRVVCDIVWLCVFLKMECVRCHRALSTTPSLFKCGLSANGENTPWLSSNCQQYRAGATPAR